jgi:hypothetical protein
MVGRAASHHLSFTGSRHRLALHFGAVVDARDVRLSPHPARLAQELHSIYLESVAAVMGA